ncbi:MAG: O-antigen ligase [Pseudomonadota bacterium]
MPDRIVAVAEQRLFTGFHHSSLQPLMKLVGGIAAYCAFCLVLLSLRPFNYVSVRQLETQHGDSLNQIGYLAAGTIAAVCIASLVDRRLLRIFLAPAWIGIFAVLVLSVMVAPNPEAVLRSVALTLICILITSCIVLLPPDERAFQIVSASAILSVLAISYAGIILIPDEAIHGGVGDEAHHAGLWRGHFAHKNLAGPTISVLIMFGIYLWRAGMKAVGMVIVALSLVFVIQTGSKTTISLVPIAVIAVLAGRVFGLPMLTVALYAAAVLALAMLTIGSVYIPFFAQITALLLDDPSFTGRATLWEYGILNIPNHLWFGTGYDNFWGTPLVTDMEYPYAWPWDFRGIVHGHNNYIDIALTTGVFGFVILFWALFIAPAVNYVKSCQIPSNRNLADLFMMIIVFLALLSFMETFFLRRMDPIWLMMVIAVVGLQLTARYKTLKANG